jgi:hypothetical protein
VGDDIKDWPQCMIPKYVGWKGIGESKMKAYIINETAH